MHGNGNESQNDPDCALAVWLFTGWHDPLKTTGDYDSWGSDNQAGSADTSVNKGQISVLCWGLFLAREGLRLWQVCSMVFSWLGLEVGHLCAGEDPKHLPLFLQEIRLLMGISVRQNLNASKLLLQRSWIDWRRGWEEKVKLQFALWVCISPGVRSW